MNSFNVETALKQLEEIVQKLENGNINLEEAFKYFEEGNQISEKLTKKIDSYERKLKILTDEYELKEFDEKKIIDEN